MEYHVHGTECMGATYMLGRTKRSNVRNNMRTKSELYRLKYGANTRVHLKVVPNGEKSYTVLIFTDTVYSPTLP